MKDVASIALEQRVDETLARYGWKIERNLAYEDVVEEKQREIDLIAARAWTRLNGREVIVRLELVVETKLLKGAEVLVGEDTRSRIQYGEQCYFSWLGLDDDDVHAQVHRAIAASGAPKEVIDRTMARFAELAYPPPEYYAPAYDLIPVAPKAPVHGTLVRLTTEKGDDVNSFASHGLRAAVSCVRARARDAIAKRAEILRTDIATAIASGDDSLIDAVLESAMSLVELFHPLVVADVRLFAVYLDEINETPWCRMANRESWSNEKPWVDFVSLDAFDEWVANVTQYYDDFFRAPVPA